MGKASKWIRSFLIGKKEEKDKKDQILSSADFPANQTAIIPATPKVKRRWSFGRSMGGKQAAHKFSKSFDSIDIIPRAVQAIEAELEIQQHYGMALATAHKKNNHVENAAAIKIQAAFRSYLARKALCALRGLVKLQALVRGHLVRKQTAATLRCMHALMAIQVRARVQRIQMADQEAYTTTTGVERQSSSARRSFSQENASRKSHNNDAKQNEKTKNVYSNHTKIERIEHGFTTYYSGDLSLLKQEHRVEEIAFATENNSPQHYRAISKRNSRRAEINFLQPEYPEITPSFMANTESSRAKVRSQSEPKQRPKSSKREKSRRTTSMEGVTVPLMNAHMLEHSSPSNARTSTRQGQEPWLIKLYRSTMSSSYKDNECDSISTATSGSAYCRSLVGYEPHVTMY